VTANFGYTVSKTLQNEGKHRFLVFSYLIACSVTFHSTGNEFYEAMYFNRIANSHTMTFFEQRLQTQIYFQRLLVENTCFTIKLITKPRTVNLRACRCFRLLWIGGCEQIHVYQVHVDNIKQTAVWITILEQFLKKISTNHG